MPNSHPNVVKIAPNVAHYTCNTYVPAIGFIVTYFLNKCKRLEGYIGEKVVLIGAILDFHHKASEYVMKTIFIESLDIKTICLDTKIIFIG